MVYVTREVILVAVCIPPPQSNLNSSLPRTCRLQTYQVVTPYS